MTTPVQHPSAPDANTISGAFNAGMAEGANPAPAAPALPTNGTGAAHAAGNILAQTGTRASEGAGVVGSALANPGATLASGEKKVKGFFDDLDIGKIIGGICGIGGAYFLGNFFGDGIFSTILTVCLAFPLMVIGSDKIGGLVNGWMGRAPSQSTAVAPQEPEQSLATARARDPLNQGHGAGVAPVSPPPLTPDQLRARLGGADTSLAPATAASARATAMQTPLLQLSNDELNQLLDATHDRIKLAADANNKVIPQAVATTERPMAGTLDRAKVEAIEAATPGATGIAFVANAQNGLSVIGIPPRTPSTNQR